MTTGPGEELVGELVDALTVDEAAALCAGFDMWRNHRVKRLGLGAIKVSDGPVGVRGDGPIGSGTPSVVLPCPTAMGATWDPALVRSAGEVLADEVRDRQASVLLAPTVNLHRTPLAGRNFECFSEDPHLTAELAAAYIDGVQSSGVSACVKHFVANDQEWERHSISAEVSERALRELYLLPFEVAVTRARVWMVMSAYNRLDGTFCSEHRWLLTDVLRGEWGFDGAVVSDWGGTHSTVPAALGGLDWQMPGPPTRFGPPLADAVRAGEVPEDVVRAMAANVLGVARRTSLLDGERTPGEVSPESPERSVDRPEARAVARSIAAASMVLLGNRDGALPLDPVPASIAVVGPSANLAWVQGGGSAQLNPRSTVTPLEGIVARFSPVGSAVVHEPGVLSVRSMPLLDRRHLEALAAESPGVAAAMTGPHDEFFLTAEYYDNPEFAGEPVSVVPMRAATTMWGGVLPPGIEGTYWARWRATFVTPADVPEGASVRFGITSAGPSRLWVDGTEVCSLWDERTPGESFFGLGSVEVTADVAAEPGARLEVVFELSNDGSPFVSAGQVGAGIVPPPDGVQRAVAAAAGADVAVVVVGLDHDTETEGRDRTTLALPPEQDDLVRAVAAVNERTVVVVNAGAPVLMPWRDEVAAVVQMWYPGMEGGHALADVLSGDVNPSGRLPTTFPAELSDTAAHHAGNPAHYPGVDGQVHYDEGVFIGYRWFDARDLTPQWCFGHGLSYTRFEYRDVELNVVDPPSAGPLSPDERPGGEPVVEVSVTVANIGDRDGHEVVQVYVAPPVGDLARPRRELRGFTRVFVPAGGQVRVSIPLDRRALAAWDPDAGGWVVAAGTHHVEVGASSRDLRASASFDVAP